MSNGFTRVSLVVVGLALLLALPVVGQAQMMREGAPPPDYTKAEQAEIIDSVCLALNEYYVFPEVAKEMEKKLRDNLKQGAYDTVANAMMFAQVLTEDMREICHDRHLGARWFSDEEIGQMNFSDTLTDEDIRREREAGQRRNWGWKKLELLPGNVGYMKFNGFSDAGWAGGTAIAALNFLAYSDALIIDLRENGGGSPSMIQLISSYFFDEPTHLNSFYIRSEDTIRQFWTQAFVEGPRMSDVDIYVLTSSYTFSGAEEFSYNMKNLKRGTIIGETTGGGAHPVDTQIFPNLNFGIRVPFGRAINPITGTNWEGVGVEPDIEVPADQALDRALVEAYSKLMERNDLDEDSRMDIEWAKGTLDRKLNPLTLDDELLKSYAGHYGPRTIRYEDGELIYQREGNPPHRMIPFSEDTFWFDDIDYFRLQVVKDDDGVITHLLGIYQGGRTDMSPKSDG